MNGARNDKKVFGPAPLGTGEGSKGQISFNFIYKAYFKDLYTKLCACTHKLEDLKVLRRSPDLLNNVKICQGQLQLILFYHGGCSHFGQVT